MTALQRILDGLEAAGCAPRRSGNGWTARCPAHDDRHPSLSIAYDGNTVALKCHGACATEAVLTALGKNWGDLFEQGATSAPRSEEEQLAAIWRRLKREADERTETYLRGDEPSLPRTWKRAGEVIPREEADYVGPGGEPRRRLPPLTRNDFATQAEYDVYEAWRVGDGQLPPRDAA